MGRTRTTKEAARELGISQASVCRLLDAMGAPKFGRSYMVDEATMEKLEERRTSAGRPKGSRSKTKDWKDGRG